MEIKPKIVVLDSEALRDNDMDWSPLKAYGREVVLYPHSTLKQMIDRVGDADAVVINNKGHVDKVVFESCKNLSYIGLTATGYDGLNIDDCNNYGITVTNVPDYSTESVAQQLFALLLEYAAHTSAYCDAVRRGEWLGKMQSMNGLRNRIELRGRTLGIIGYGNIGSAVARIALAFGMKILCYTYSEKQAPGVEFCSIERLYKESDIISLHCRHSEQTDKIIDEKAISMMKNGVVLCNVSRGRLIDDDAVCNALKGGKLGFYLADALTGEPNVKNNPLINLENTLITPHIGWSTQSSLDRLCEMVCQNLIACFEGKPQNVVNNPKL